MLQYRTLSFDPVSGNLYYDYVVCDSKFLGICTKKVMKRDSWDMKVESQRKEIIDSGFVCSTGKKPI